MATSPNVEYETPPPAPAGCNEAVADIIARFNRHFYTDGRSWARIGKREYTALVLAIKPPASGQCTCEIGGFPCPVHGAHI